MRALPLLLPAALLLSLACAGGKDAEDADPEGDDPSDETTPTDDTTAGDPIEHPACDAYLACVADVTPEATATALDQYGDGSTCWEDADSAALCESACVSALGDAHLAYPGSEACDDGTPVPSSSALVETHWTLAVTGAAGGLCADLGDIPSFVADFDVTDGTTFTGDLSFRQPFAWAFAVDCTNDGLDVTCTHPQDADGLEGSFAARVSDDLSRLSGSFALTWQGASCTWDLDSDVEPDTDTEPDEHLDLDGDGLGNGWEAEVGLDPFAADTDGDGLDDGYEVNDGTDPFDDDSDGDGWSDGDEVAAGTDPTDAGSHP